MVVVAAVAVAVGGSGGGSGNGTGSRGGRAGLRRREAIRIDFLSASVSLSANYGDVADCSVLAASFEKDSGSMHAVQEST